MTSGEFADTTWRPLAFCCSQGSTMRGGADGRSVVKAKLTAQGQAIVARQTLATTVGLQ